MKMTKTKHTPLALLLACCTAAALTACTLDEHPHDQIDEESIYGTPEALYRNSVASLYNYIGGNTDGQGLQGTCRGVYDLQTFASDEAMLPTRGGDWYDGGIWHQLYLHSWDSGHEIFKNSWLYLYKVIALCNHSLDVISTYGSVLTEADYKAYRAEVRALRAIYYWYLLDLFGRVPIITSTDLSMNVVKQSERSEVFRFCISELTEVLGDLSPACSQKAGDYYARVTRPVACFVLAKLYLNAEVYTDDDWTDGVRPHGEDMAFAIGKASMNAWEAAICYCTMLSVMGYSLEADYSTNFSVRNEASGENIWIVPMDKDLYSNQQQNMSRSYHYRHAAAYGFDGENGACATQRVLDIFGYGTEEEDRRFRLCYWADWVLDLNDAPVKDRMGQLLIYYPREAILQLSASPYVETAGARMKKYAIDKNATKGGKLMDNDIVLFRYADVLLMRAEALLRNGQDGQGDFVKVRRRVGMPDRELTLDNLLDERLLELCWEGWRRQDLVRFGKYKSAFTPADGYFKTPDESDGHTTVFPIPGDILKLNPNLTQNPGY